MNQDKNPKETIGIRKNDQQAYNESNLLACNMTDKSLTSMQAGLRRCEKQPRDTDPCIAYLQNMEPSQLQGHSAYYGKLIVLTSTIILGKNLLFCSQ